MMNQGRFKRLLSRLFSAVLLATTLSFISGCNQQDDNNTVGVVGGMANMAFTAPDILLQSRTIVRQNLILRVSINGQAFQITPDAEGQYVFQTTLPPLSSTVVSIEWVELVEGEELPLARASKPLNVGSVSSPVLLRFTEFDTSMDADNDGYSNLQERR